MPFNHNNHYHSLLLRQVPAGARRALDVGCGTGAFARRLAARGIDVDAVDPSAEVIRSARQQPLPPNAGAVHYQQADATQVDLPEGHYDVISCLASLHHMPFDTVSRFRAALSPGGVLLVLGCFREEWPTDAPMTLLAVPANAVMRVATWAKEQATRPQRTVKAPVSAADMTLREIRSSAAELLPGNTIRRLLFWRYLLVFRNNAGR
ncbi:class I SAM-dependent methyltransferase [Streptoalloteichus hindustanus]|uniref:class I SAM-dependent methyltransferase n=1 Tax=Streptoalloteichus hindustanus TaxID=2017 RepID=UPI0009363A7B|nr:class I SAM-dependent methyltransferase [Streptoalloteichus hindustanus]